MTKPHIDIDECVQRYCAALDEIQYVAEQLASHMKPGSETYEQGKDYLEGLHARMEDMSMDVENLRLDNEREDI